MWRWRLWTQACRAHVRCLDGVHALVSSQRSASLSASAFASQAQTAVTVYESLDPAFGLNRARDSAAAPWSALRGCEVCRSLASEAVERFNSQTSIAQLNPQQLHDRACFTHFSAGANARDVTT
jgi:hypothetical protein